MKSVVELEIDMPQAKLAEIFTDPENNIKWMDDLEARSSIKNAHRRHMEAFKRFAEAQT